METLMNGAAIPVTTFIPPISDEWTNARATAPDFDTIAARKMLDAAGYTLDTANKKRIDPKTGNPIQLTLLTPLRGTDATLWNIGYATTYYLNAIGIRTSHMALPDYLLVPRAMESRDFDILVRNITLAHAPFGLHALLHSSRDQSGTDAYCGVRDKTLDASLEVLWSGMDKESVQQASLAVQARLAETLPYLPICSVPEYAVVQNGWSGLVNQPGDGVDNRWTWMGIHRTETDSGQTSASKDQSGKTPAAGVQSVKTLVLAVLGGLDTLNPLLADSKNEWRTVYRAGCEIHH